MHQSFTSKISSDSLSVLHASNFILLFFLTLIIYLDHRLTKQASQNRNFMSVFARTPNLRSPRNHYNGFLCVFIVIQQSACEGGKLRKTSTSSRLSYLVFLPRTTRSELSLVSKGKGYRKYRNCFLTKRARISTLHLKLATFWGFWL